jgi:hypothetical protein
MSPTLRMAVFLPAAKLHLPVELQEKKGTTKMKISTHNTANTWNRSRTHSVALVCGLALAVSGASGFAATEGHRSVVAKLPHSAGVASPSRPAELHPGVTIVAYSVETEEQAEIVRQNLRAADQAAFESGYVGMPYGLSSIVVVRGSVDDELLNQEIEARGNGRRLIFVYVPNP